MAEVQTITAAIALGKAGMTLKRAKAAIEELIEAGKTTVVLPRFTHHAHEILTKSGVKAKPLAAKGFKIEGDVSGIHVKTIREQLAMSIRQFADAYGLNPRTVEGWEQGRSMDQTAQAYLRVICNAPYLVAYSQRKTNTDADVLDFTDEVARLRG